MGGEKVLGEPNYVFGEVVGREKVLGEPVGHPSMKSVLQPMLSFCFLQGHKNGCSGGQPGCERFVQASMRFVQLPMRCGDCGFLGGPTRL